MGIVDTWHATSNFKIMTHAVKKVLQKLTKEGKRSQKCRKTAIATEAK